MYEPEPVAGLDGRRIECARGKVVRRLLLDQRHGLCPRHSADYDRWRCGIARVVLGACAGRISAGRSAGTWSRRLSWGRRPLKTEMSRYEDPLCMPMRTPPAAPGAVTDDYNGVRQDGFARMQMTIRARPALQRGRPPIFVGAVAGPI